MSKRKQHQFMILISIYILFILTSCSSSNKAEEPFDPKSYFSNTDSSEISLDKLYDYVVESSNIESPALNRLEFKLGDDNKLSMISMEIIDLSDKKSYMAIYDSETELFKIKVEKQLSVSEDELFDSSLLESAESLIQNSDISGGTAVYFLNMLSSGDIDIRALHDADFLLLKGNRFKEIDDLDEIIPPEDFYFFGVYRDSDFQDIPEYFAIKK